MNGVAQVAQQDELFFHQVGEDLDPEIDQLNSLFWVGKRQVVSSWTNEPTPASDEEQLKRIVSECTVCLTMTAIPIVRTPNFGHNVHDGTDDWTARGLLHIVTAGLADWMLRGRVRDVRACLWCGDLFRADRSSAVFDQPSCRTAYHRALNTAQNSDADGLLGIFHCIECQGKMLISGLSGLIREVSFIYVGGVFRSMYGSENICRQCAAENHPDWAEYVLPMNVAA